MAEEKIYKIEDLYIADVIQITDRIFTKMELNNYQPWKEYKTLKENKIFIKIDESTCQHLATGIRYEIFGRSWGVGNVGVDEMFLFNNNTSIETLSLSEIKKLEKELRMCKNKSSVEETINNFLHNKEPKEETKKIEYDFFNDYESEDE